MEEERFFNAPIKPEVAGRLLGELNFWTCTYTSP